ncbi:hypothetical protein Bca4012_102973 [Brassica carinata]
MRGAPWRVLQTTIKAAASRGPLGGIYRPIGAAFPNNPTRRQRLRGATGSERGRALTLSGAPFQELGPGPSLRRFSGLQFEREGRVIRLTWGRVEDFGSSRAFGRSGGDLASEFTTACQGAPGILSSDFGQRVRRALGQKAWGATCVQRLRWFTGFCNSHQVSHFARSSSITSEISVASRFRLYIAALLPNKHRLGLAKAGCLVECSLTLFVRGLVISGSYAYNPAKLGGGERITTESVGAKSAKIPAHRVMFQRSRVVLFQVTTMILPRAPEARPGQLRPGAYRRQKRQADRCSPKADRATHPKDWVICAPAAFLGCGSRFSGSLSESNPNSPSPVTTMDQPGSIHKSRQALVMFRKHMERGTGEDLAVIFCRRQACLAGQNFLSHRHNLSITEIPANSLFTLANNA